MKNDKNHELFSKLVALNALRDSTSHGGAPRKAVARLLRLSYDKFVGHHRQHFAGYLSRRYTDWLEEHGVEFHHEPKWFQTQALDALADAYMHLTLAELSGENETDQGVLAATNIDTRGGEDDLDDEYAFLDTEGDDELEG